MKKMIPLLLLAITVTKTIEIYDDGRRVEVYTVEKDGKRMVLDESEAKQLAEELPGTYRVVNSDNIRWNPL